jgi:hypothetical protein
VLPAATLNIEEKTGPQPRPGNPGFFHGEPAFVYGLLTIKAALERVVQTLEGWKRSP